MKSFICSVICLLAIVAVADARSRGRSVHVEHVRTFVEPVTVIENVSSTEYAEVPNIQVDRIDSYSSPVGQVYGVDHCGNTVSLNRVNSCNQPTETVVEKLVEVPNRQVVVRDQIVHEQVVRQKNVKVERVQRVHRDVRVDRNVEVNVHKNVEVNSGY